MTAHAIPLPTLKTLSTKISRNMTSLPNVHSLDKPLHHALWALSAARDAGFTDSLSADDIRTVLEDQGVAITTAQIINATNRAKGKLIKGRKGDLQIYKIAQKGRDILDSLDTGKGIEVHYVEPGKRWKARKTFDELSHSLEGELLVTDRYYGERTLFALETLADRKEMVRFITAETGEKTNKMHTLMKDLMNDKSNIEIRIYPNKGDLHDRHIISSDAIVLIGHGIKDIGKSESFVVKLPESIAEDMISQARKCFEERWNKSAPI